MSATTGTPPVGGTADPTNGKPLISSSPADQGTAAASGGAAAAILVLLIWGLSTVHIVVPGEAAAAMSTLLGIVVHWAVLKYGLPAT